MRLINHDTVSGHGTRYTALADAMICTPDVITLIMPMGSAERMRNTSAAPASSTTASPTM